ncbi:hypothetical protein HPP92_010184 [Vanilla planifolia]|uniref:Pathogenesis-related homeodomain protein n=1 Tax=Vanilla planifolia TaxID=51239 RepID=A0A835R4U9_VANPL|nr:hypothetical protein HPP92_010285 [Vanilla planifolia]KAG0482100.1 hypothetical protein HPP92_010184 [Vanilla planifolia]
MNQNCFKVARSKRCYLKEGYRSKQTCKSKNMLKGTPIETLQKKIGCKLLKCGRALKQIGKTTSLTRGDNSKNKARTVENKSIRRRRWRRKKKNVEQDEISHMQRRAKYLLIKMKLEQNLIDAYSGDGWKGQSREKIKPEKELQRAQRQILKCKLSIRDSIHQLEYLGSEGRIEDSFMHPDGSVYHEYIFCAKCKSREAFPDNDIILCDGSCNRGFHQKCLEPPLDKIPPGEQGWLCKICDCKMEILETINAHLGTSFTVYSSWEDIFKEATVVQDDEGPDLNPDEDWPSDHLSDEDYCPDFGSGKADFDEQNVSDDPCSSSDGVCSSEGSLNHPSYLGSPESIDHEIKYYRRQRTDVDYKKLNDEMFGKEPNEGEGQSEDEDWGPYRRRPARVASDADINSTDPKSKDHKETGSLDTISCNKKSLFRIPRDATEKLRQSFAENELPSRTVKQSLSRQLGISAEKVDKWFKNARYAALKIRKQAELASQYHHGSILDKGHRYISDAAVSLDDSLLPLASIFCLPRHKKRMLQSNNLMFASCHVKKQKVSTPTVIQESSRLEKAACCGISEGGNITTMDIIDDAFEAEQPYINELRRLWILEKRLGQLQQQLPSHRDNNIDAQVNNHLGEKMVIYVPVAEVIEKA